MIPLTVSEEARIGRHDALLAATHRPSGVRLLSNEVLRGCNVHHTSTVTCQEVDLGRLAGLRSDSAGGDFARRFLCRFLHLRVCIPGNVMRESFLERLRSPAGAPFEEVLLEAILAIQTAASFAMNHFDAIDFARIVPAASPGKVLLVWETRVSKFSSAAARVGLLGFLELLPEELHPHRAAARHGFDDALADLQSQARRKQRSTTTAVLALAANRRELPCETLRGPYLRLGHGVAQRLIYASVTDRTSLAAAALARNKYLTNRRLAQLDLPVTRQIRAATVKEAIAAAEAIGFPVVVKPLQEKQATGVSVGIAHAQEVVPAFVRAQKAGRRVIVESFVPGTEHRLLVVGGRFIAALRTVAPTVTGNGASTIAELIEALNADPLRNGLWLQKIKIDDELLHDLKLAGYGPDDILEKDKAIAVRPAANVATGGLHTDVTDDVHPDNREMAVRAAAGIGLDVAGVDFMTDDISRSYRESGGKIIEVNARPGLCMHTWPRYGRSRWVADAVLEQMFPPGVTGRIPVGLIVGEHGTDRIARHLDALLRAAGRHVGLATGKRCLVDGQATGPQEGRPQKSARMLLRNPRVDTLVTSVSPRTAMTRGLGLEMCDAAAIVNPADGDADGEFHQSLEVVVKATRGRIVVGADNGPALQLLGTLDPRRVILLCVDPEDPALARHAAAGGVVASSVRRPDGDRIVLSRGDSLIASVPVVVEATEKNRRGRIETRMFAAALASGMGLTGAEIEAAARTAGWGEGS